jgi:uncharacterized repeat protein (TIGR01451 family)
MRCLVLLLTLIPLLACALATPAAAQPDSLAFTSIEVGNSHEVYPDGSQTWSEGGFATIFDPKGGDNISLFRAVTPGGAVIEKTPETVDGNYATLGWGTPSHLLPPETPPDLGSYQLTAWNLDGDSVIVTSLPLEHFSEDAPSILSPPDSGTITDTQPIFSWEPALDASPYPLSGYWIEVHGPSDEWAPPHRSVWFRMFPKEENRVRFNDDGAAGVPELTPGSTYRIAVDQTNKALVDPGDDARPEQWHAHASWRALEFTIASSSLTSFEEDRYPWAGFAAGPDDAAIWREAFTPVGAHSATFAIHGEADGEAITGLRLALPVDGTQPTGCSLRSWAYVPEWTGTDSSCFFGFSLTEDYPDSTTGWSQAIGWEAISATQSNLQLGGTSIALPFGLPAAGWHLVRVNYHRGADSLRVWLDGVLVADEVDIGAAGQAPHYAVLGALGQTAAARHLLRLDDVSILPMLDVPWPPDSHLFGRIEGLEQVVEGQQYSYEIRYGNGYAVLGTDPLTEELADPMYVSVTLPPGYSYVSADPVPDRELDETVVWEQLTPAFGQHGSIHLEAQVPADVAAASTETLYLWVTDDPGAAAANPPNGTSPCEATWGCPQDVLPQAIFLAEDLAPDLWVRKDGPRYASPGDAVNYAITVGNRGLAPAAEVEVRDLLPELLGGDDILLGEIAQLDPGDTWRGVIDDRELPWGVEHGTLLLNLAYVSTAPAEVVFDNNESVYETTVLGAHDPNQISVSPEGEVALGGTLTYTIECENTGAGTAYAVYATAVLDPSLDDDTLVLPAGLAYLSLSRTIVWNVGTLGPDAGASISFTINVAADAPAGAPIIGQAIIYFPSVPEVTPTNIVVNWLASLFPDVPRDHWAYDEIMACVDAGVVAGYPDGSYQPGFDVTRAQMAVFIARAIATPTGEEGVQAWEAPETPTFPDVADYSWCYKHVEMLYDKGIVEGYPDGFYRPATWVSRDQMAVYMARAVADPVGEEGLEGYTPPAKPSFLDADAEHWAYKHIEYCAENSIVAGYADGFYRPSKLVTRDQMAVYVARAFGLM